MVNPAGLRICSSRLRGEAWHIAESPMWLDRGEKGASVEICPLADVVEPQVIT
jgi:hypothetical protein